MFVILYKTSHRGPWQAYKEIYSDRDLASNIALSILTRGAIDANDVRVFVARCIVKPIDMSDEEE